MAIVRAAHQKIDGGCVFDDPLAARLVTVADADHVFDAVFDPEQEPVRLAVAARARFAEEALVAALDDGVSQAVVLGAGLDTFAYRHSYDARVFEVDFPATQAWKRELLAAAEIAEPPSLTFAPIDFEAMSLADGLAEAGFEADRPAFFVWMGVVPYLTPEAVYGTLGFVGSRPGGSGVAFDYGEPPAAMSPEQREGFERRAAWAGQRGEPFLSHFVPGDLSARLSVLGLSLVEDVTYEDLAVRYESGLTGPSRGSGGHVVHASVLARHAR
ncbi:SAM-dependent methyltransferase [Actinomadura sp. DC4]|uniref:class I SAM-dependent methyltransferase n=1 Tax=Actinomadura sp. DC4 TaxID=3055069 RepID=UPI0025AF5A8C|nr:SAM-dependent methyltransferase [Actinomadura sp. DC4]MDN3359866.1 SAM-dependent methyltransferase [Actinomadura sp. DC4]